MKWRVSWQMASGKYQRTLATKQECLELAAKVRRAGAIFPPRILRVRP